MCRVCLLLCILFVYNIERVVGNLLGLWDKTKLMRNG